MKRKITRVIIFLLLSSVSSGILAGCGKNTEIVKDPVEENSMIEALPKGNIAEEGSDKYIPEEEAEAADNSLSGGPELDWITLEEVLRPSVLQITCGGYTGSGVVWEITEEEVRVVSSGHLLKYGETCEVECYAGIYYEAEVEQVLEDCDVGFAVFSVKALQEDQVELTAVIPCGRDKKDLIQGEELAVYGSMDYVAGNFVKGYLIEAEKEMQLEGYESAKGLLLGGILQEGDGGRAGISDVDRPGGEEDTVNMNGPGGERADAANRNGSGEADGIAGKGTHERGMIDAGMSGSGVFDRQGRLLGILAGGDGREGFAAVPVWKFAGKRGQAVS